jgi:hypothetical protein
MSGIVRFISIVYPMMGHKIKGWSGFVEKRSHLAMNITEI